MDFLKKPLPGWATLVLFVFAFMGGVSAAPTIWNGSINILSGGFITDTNAAINTCVATNASKHYTYGISCLDTTNPQVVLATKQFNAAATPNPVASNFYGPPAVVQATAAPTTQPGNIQINGQIGFANATQIGTGLWQFMGNDTGSSTQFVFNANGVGGTGDVADFDVAGVPAVSFTHAGDAVVTHNVAVTNFICAGTCLGSSPGDMSATRGNGTGVIFLGDATHYLFYNGSKYVLNTAALTAGGSVSGGAHNACSSTSGWPCEATVTLTYSGQTGTSNSVTVPSGSVCTATIGAWSNLSQSQGSNLSASLSGTTLLVGQTYTAAQTGNETINVTCL